MADFFAGLGLDSNSFLTTILLIVGGIIVLSVICRFIFGKHSVVGASISSAIGILFIYSIVVILQSTGLVQAQSLAPLPFIDINEKAIQLFSFTNSDYTAICSHLLSAVILAFLTNLADSWLPRGKKFLTWFLFRCLTLIIAYALHLLVVGLFRTYLPEGIVVYAPTVLLVLLLVLLLTSLLNFPICAILTVVNPIIGGLYTFFFSTIIGKMVSKALLTTLLIALLVMGLGSLGILIIPLTVSVLPVYIPVAAILATLWYIQHKFF